MACYPADVVWACASAAQRVNGEYVKHTYTRSDGVELTANRVLIEQYLRQYSEDAGAFGSQVTDADFEAGCQARDHVRGWLLRYLTGQVNDYQKNCVRLAEQEEFDPMRERLALIASLPSSVERDQRRQTVQVLSQTGQPLPISPGQPYAGTVEILDCVFSANYCTYFVSARTSDSNMLRFSQRQPLVAGQQVQIRGRVREHRDTVTVLHYVRTSTKQNG